MDLFITLLGAAVVLLTLRDIFQQLFRPGGAGSLSRGLMRGIWNLFRRLAARRPALLTLAGPCVLLSIIVTWTVLLTVGWALVFWPHLPGGFRYATGLDPSTGSNFMNALYLSLVTLTTLGYGDITPTGPIFRFLAPLEALIGFGLLTAAISWVLSVYPVLSRRRSLAQEVSLLRRAESEIRIPAVTVDAETLERTLDALATRLISVSGDLLRFPVTYYFYDDQQWSSLPAQMHSLARMAEEGRAPDRPPAVRLRATVLRGAVDDFAETVASRFLRLPSATPAREVLDAYARDHLRQPSSDGPPGRGQKKRGQNR
jgi:voltage-gated potassium channel Kch